MPNLVLWILAVYGITFALADASLFDRWIPIRPWFKQRAFFADLLTCYFCVGFWVGGGLLALWLGKAALTQWRESLLYIFAGAAGSYVLDHVILALEVFLTKQQGKMS